MKLNMFYVDFFQRAKWPYGYRCPRCGHSGAYIITSRRQPLYQCNRCRHQTSLTSGTVMSGSKTSLAKWYKALQLMSRRHGINALQLQKAISVTYKTAWLMLKKVRQAISLFDTGQRVAGQVELFVTVYGYARFSPFLHHNRKKQCLLASVGQTNGRFRDYLKLKASSFAFTHNCAVSTTLLPVMLSKLNDINAKEWRISLPFSSPDGFAVASCANQAKQWLHRLYRGIGRLYIQHYLNEFAFRYNMRRNNEPILNKLANLAMLCSNSGQACSQTT